MIGGGGGSLEGSERVNTDTALSPVPGMEMCSVVAASRTYVPMAPDPVIFILPLW